jgi:hypothetical protein
MILSPAPTNGAPHPLKCTLALRHHKYYWERKRKKSRPKGINPFINIHLVILSLNKACRCQQKAAKLQQMLSSVFYKIRAAVGAHCSTCSKHSTASGPSVVTLTCSDALLFIVLYQVYSDVLLVIMLYQYLL